MSRHVKQGQIQYLMLIEKYPAALFSIEKEIKLGELNKRCDIIIYKDVSPWMIIECKESTVILDEKVLSQILRYHLAIPVPFLFLTNGVHNFLFEKKEGVFNEIKTFPNY